ncbi:Tudor/PWWP/MBT superfamily protein [Abeliophyllum distichum]|uniref:Tudor/PWWP/MBT superfamily protein n=1 Tax=Abeliophyllum distichum TaxID=126358 RepID=A0ABD1UMJ2_9LAMI
MSRSGKTVEEELTAAGNRLLQPPDSPDELLPLLDQAEDFLSKVEQSPAKSVQTAISPLMKALVAEELLKHSDVDVKVAVASCISEITRITAPDAPYDDDKMKDIFQLIVSSFEHLFDQSSRSYAKRVMILETVSKVRSCVIMLDLECDQMISEMFQHFLKAIRDFHPENIFTSMETIMTLVLDESEAISPELLTILLASVKRNNEDFLPVARKLGERVFENCAVKLKPYLTRTVKSLGTSLDDYSEVVSSGCEPTDGSVGHNSSTSRGDQSVAKDVTEGTSLEEENPNVKILPKSIVSNGVNETGNGVILTDADFKKAEYLDSKLTSKNDSGNLAAQKPKNSESDAEQAAKQRRKKPSSSNNSTETSGIGDDEKGVEPLPDHRDSEGKDVHDSLGDVATVKAAKPFVKVKETGIQLSPSKASESKAVNVASASPTGILLDESRTKKAGRPKKKENLIKEKRVSANAASKKASDGASDSEAKKQRHFGKREPAEIPENQVLAEEDACEDGGTISQSEANSPNQTEKSVDTNSKMKDGSSSKRQDDKKHGHVKARVEKDKLKSSAKDEAKDMVASPRSPKKSSYNESNQEETPRTSTKRKGTPGTDKASGTIEFGENLVGSKVKVWWPKDHMFYEGIVDSFDSVKKKHKILYNDGDEERLNLRKERWEFIDDGSVVDAGQPVECASTDTPSEMQKKKAKTNPEASTKDGKMKLSRKSKLKNTATSSGRKSKDGAKADPKSDDETSSSGSKSRNQSQKLSGKSIDDSLKASGKSKDVDTAKSSGHSKQDTQKIPKSNGRGNTKSSLSKSKETDNMKEKATDSGKMSEIKKGKLQDKSKPPESETKSGKKRRR